MKIKIEIKREMSAIWKITALTDESVVYDSDGYGDRSVLDKFINHLQGTEIYKKVCDAGYSIYCDYFVSPNGYIKMIITLPNQLAKIIWLKSWRYETSYKLIEIATEALEFIEAHQNPAVPEDFVYKGKTREEIIDALATQDSEVDDLEASMFFSVKEGITGYNGMSKGDLIDLHDDHLIHYEDEDEDTSKAKFIFILGYKNLDEGLVEFKSKKEADYEAQEWVEIEADTLEEAKSKYEICFENWQKHNQRHDFKDED